MFLWSVRAPALLITCGVEMLRMKQSLLHHCCHDILKVPHSRHAQHVTAEVKFKWKMLEVAGGNFNGVFPLDYGNTVKWNNTIYIE